MSTPYGSQLDTTKMFWPVALPRRSQFRAAAKVKAAKFETDRLRNNCIDPVGVVAPLERNGEASLNAMKMVFGADMEMSVTQTRVVTASALGTLAAKLREGSLQCILDPLWSALTSVSGVQRQVISSLFMELLLNFSAAPLFIDPLGFPR